MRGLLIGGGGVSVGSMGLFGDRPWTSALLIVGCLLLGGAEVLPQKKDQTDTEQGPKKRRDAAVDWRKIVTAGIAAVGAFLAPSQNAIKKTSRECGIHLHSLPS